MTSTGFDWRMRATSLLADASPGWITPLASALSRRSSRRPACRALLSGPWHAKQFSERIERMSRLKSTRSAPGAAPPASETATAAIAGILMSCLRSAAGLARSNRGAARRPGLGRIRHRGVWRSSDTLSVDRLQRPSNSAFPSMPDHGPIAGAGTVRASAGTLAPAVRQQENSVLGTFRIQRNSPIAAQFGIRLGMIESHGRCCTPACPRAHVRLQP